MKRYGNIYSKIYDMENLKLAHKNARKDKTYYKEVQMVDNDLEFYLTLIQTMLKSETYNVSKYDVSIICDKGKERELMKLPYFPDRIIQWAIMLQIEHIFMETFCAHSCASIKQKGIHKAITLADKYMADKENSVYCLKMDITKFYPNINHLILKQLLRKKIKDIKLLRLLDKIIDSYPSEKGVPIGSYLSQYFANYYLTYFDHWLKEEKHMKYVIRYMDDIIIFHNSKDHLHILFREIEEYLNKNLKLSIKDNWQIFPSRVRGVDFVGYRHFGEYRLLRKKTTQKIKSKMLDIKKKQDAKQLINYSEWCSVNSYIGWLRYCNSYNLYKKYITPIIPSLVLYYKIVVQHNNPSLKSFNAVVRYYKKIKYSPNG